LLHFLLYPSFPNNKPWVTKDIKASLNRKKVAFRSGDKEEMKKVQRELREKITEGKESYKRKLLPLLLPLLSPGPITITAEDVRCELGRLRPGKAAGPGVSRCVRLSCAESSGTSST